MEHSSLLGAINLFESLDPDDLDALSSRLDQVHFDAGATIFKQGDPGGTLFIVKEGSIDIQYSDGSETIKLTTLVPGQYFGELSLFDGQPRSASAVANKPCTLLGLDRDDFIAFIKKNPDASIGIMAELADRMRQTNALFSSQVSRNVNELEQDRLTLGQRVADRVAAFGGSWPFIGTFSALMAVWMTINAIRGIAWDPYPFILLNLILSTLAALQAPIIMMSQNRQSAKDKLLAENDFAVNLKSEIGIQTLIRGQTELLARLSLLERQIGPVQRRAPTA